MTTIQRNFNVGGKYEIGHNIGESYCEGAGRNLTGDRVRQWKWIVICLCGASCENQGNA